MLSKELRGRAITVNAIAPGPTATDLFLHGKSQELIDHMAKLQFIRAGLTVNLLVAERIDDVLPKLMEAAAAVPESEKEMKAAAIERM